jgi:hypothetical protein
MNGLFANMISLAPGRNRSRRRGRVGPRLEILEDRTPPSQYDLTVRGTLSDARGRAWAYGRFGVFTMYGQPL